MTEHFAEGFYIHSSLNTTGGKCVAEGVVIGIRNIGLPYDFRKVVLHGAGFYKISLARCQKMCVTITCKIS